ncbi:MAG TPA: hypothetical protein VLE44_02550 [Candidatus Saccharimonadales bacterium]|nr:hypothetical protein [Candidatus Saccharimonadales bacterium]
MSPKSQKWVEYPDVKNEAGELLIWPKGFIPVPGSHEVAFLVSRYHKETGNDVNWDEVSTIALHVAGKHLDALSELQDKSTPNSHWEEYEKAMDIVIQREKAKITIEDTIELNRRSSIEF